jgi:glucokinase
VSDRGAIGAIDIGGTKIAVGVVDDQGHVLGRTDVPTATIGEPTSGLARLLDVLAGLAATQGTELRGVGVAATGRHRDSVLTDLSAFLPGWDGVALAPPIRARLGVGCALENDADAVALAEHRWGAVAGTEPLLYVTVSTGIGAGLVVDGRLYRGSGGAHPELGHHVVDAAGPACFCGAHGCLESMASGRAIEGRWFERTGRRDAAAAVFDADAAGDPAATGLIDEVAAVLGLGLANLASILAPAVIVLGGGVSARLDRLRPAIDAALTARVLVPLPSLRGTTFGHDAGLAGAAAVWLQEEQPMDGRSGVDG